MTDEAHTERRALSAVACVLCCVCLAASAEGARGKVRALMVPNGPAIDGALSDPLWKRAPVLDLHPLVGDTPAPATTARVLFDAKNLYAAIECEEPAAKLKTDARGRDSSVWTDDCVEIYILPHPAVGYKQIGINSAGTICDQAYPPNGQINRNWNADIKVAASVEPGKGWKVALSVPLKDIGAYAGDDQTWRFNVTRMRRTCEPAREYSWALLPSTDFHQPDAFGVIEHINIPVRADGVTRKVEQFRSGLQWVRLQEPRSVRRVFAHPFDPSVAWCTSADGLMATRDGGTTWKAVESASREAVGDVTALAVSPGRPGTQLMGTDDRGVFLSEDDGKTWRPLGSEAEKLASLHVECVGFCPSDPSARTIMASHGLSGPGLSISRDLGATWEVLGTDRYLWAFTKRGQTVVAAGSMVSSEGKVSGIQRSGTDGQRCEETIRDIRPSEPAAPASGWRFFFATLDGTILASFDDGKTWREAASSERSTWVSIFFTNGPSSRIELLGAYDPHREGVAVSRHRFANGLGERMNAGLYVGPLVKSGANCAVNANGSVYYIAMNNSLWVGRWVLPNQGPAVAQAWCLPALVRVAQSSVLEAQGQIHQHVAALASSDLRPEHLHGIARAAGAIDERRAEMKFSVLAEVRHPEGPRALKAVTADLSPLGGSPSALMYDDGKHNDEKPGDGIFALDVQFTPSIFTNQRFQPTMLLTVTATDQNGVPDSWPATVSIPREPVAIVLSREGGYSGQRTEGAVKVSSVRNEGLTPGTSALCIAGTGAGPWKGAWLMPGIGVNGAGLDSLTFYVKGDTNQEVFVHLIDHHKFWIGGGDIDFLDEPHWSAGVPLIGGGYLKAVTSEYQKVRVPVAKLLPKGTYFLRWHCIGIGLSVLDDGKSGTYYIDGVQLDP